jgi:hypothetical protein
VEDATEEDRVVEAALAAALGLVDEEKEEEEEEEVDDTERLMASEYNRKTRHTTMCFSYYCVLKIL